MTKLSNKLIGMPLLYFKSVLRSVKHIAEKFPVIFKLFVKIVCNIVK